MRLAAVLSLLASLAARAEARPAQAGASSSIQWIEDDYPAALAKARAAHKPLFVDIWATWCHSCLSMKRYVFVDPGMGQVASQAVWTSVEQETPKNRAFVERFPVQGLPTFLVLDPNDESVLGQWLGSGTVAQMRSLVQAAALELQARQVARSKGGAAAESAASLARKGDEASLRKEFAAAAAAYEQAVQKSAADDPFRGQRLVQWASAQARVGTPEALRSCAQTGLAQLDRIPDTSVAADYVSTVSGCASQLAKKDPAAKALEAQLREAALSRLSRLLADAQAPLSADDRSDALGMVTELQDEAGRHDQALVAADKRAALLRAAQAAAPDAEIASTFDPHLTAALVYLGRLPEAEALLTARVKELPQNYNPQASLARVLLLEKKLPQAQEAIDAALGLAPRGAQRRVGLLAMKAKILEAQGKPSDAVLREQLEVLESLPKTQRRPEAEAQLRAKLGKPAPERKPNG